MPTLDQIQQLANQWGVDPLSVAAFAGANRRLPNNQNELATFVGVLTPVAQADGLDLTIIEGYLQESRATTSSIAGIDKTQIVQWAQSRNYLDQNGNLVFTPIAGQGYPNGENLGSVPGGVPSPTPAPASAPLGIQLPSIPDVVLPVVGPVSPLLLGGVGVAGYLLLSRRRR